MTNICFHHYHNKNYCHHHFITSKNVRFKIVETILGTICSSGTQLRSCLRRQIQPQRHQSQQRPRQQGIIQQQQILLLPCQLQQYQSFKQYCTRPLSTSATTTTITTNTTSKESPSPSQRHRPRVTIRSSFDWSPSSSSSSSSSSLLLCDHNSLHISTKTIDEMDDNPNLNSIHNSKCTTDNRSSNNTNTNQQQSLMSYTRGWAWQTVLLQQRLLYKKQQEELSKNTTTNSNSNINNNNNYNNENHHCHPTPNYHHNSGGGDDTILFLEHEPVYTLGRGADETHIKDLFNSNASSSSESSSLEPPILQQQQQQQQEIESCRQRLSRTNHHKNSTPTDQEYSSRLIMDSNTYRTFVDRFGTNQILDLKQENNDSDDDTNTLRMVNLLCDHYVPQHPVRLPIISSDGHKNDGKIRNDNIEVNANHGSHQPTTTTTTTATTTTSIPLYRVERGGQITYHGPGQLMIYPILDLAGSSSSSSNDHIPPFWKKDLHWLVHQMEQVMIDTTIDLLSQHQNLHNNIDGTSNTHYHNGMDPMVVVGRDDQHTGVWVTTTTTTPDGETHHNSIPRIQKKKIAAIGISASRWITSHGICYNIHPNLNHYDPIVPCGISSEGSTIEKKKTSKSSSSEMQPEHETSIVEYGVTSLQQLLQQQRLSSTSSSSNSHLESAIPPLSMGHVANVVLKHMQKIFQIDVDYGRRIR